MPDGELLYRSEGDTFMSINEAMNTHYPGVPFSIHTPKVPTLDGDVALRLLTAEPLLIFINGEQSIEEQRQLIPAFLSSFNYAAYLQGWELGFDLSYEGIELGLTDVYIINALGQPDSWVERTTSAGSMSIMTYSQYGLSLTFLQGQLVEVIEVRR